MAPVRSRLRSPATRTTTSIDSLRCRSRVAGRIYYSYDAAGNLLSLTDPVGNETTYAYDGLGR